MRVRLLKHNSRVPRVLLINGFGQSKDSELHSSLQKYLIKYRIVIDELSPVYPRNGIYCLNNYKEEYEDYDLIIGFSMGGVVANAMPENIPVLFINPGFDIKKVIGEKYPEHKKDYWDLETLSQKTNRDVDNIWAIFGNNDKFRPIIYPGLLKYYPNFRPDHIYSYPGKHVPTDDEIKKFIVPVIREIIC